MTRGAEEHFPTAALGFTVSPRQGISHPPHPHNFPPSLLKLWSSEKRRLLSQLIPNSNSTWLGFYFCYPVAVFFFGKCKRTIIPWLQNSHYEYRMSRGWRTRTSSFMSSNVFIQSVHWYLIIHKWLWRIRSCHSLSVIMFIWTFAAQFPRL